MLEHDRIHVSKDIDFNKNGNQHNCIVFHYWDFFEARFRLQLKLCNSYHDMTQESIHFDDNVIASIKKKITIELTFGL